jgi:hypothetical protein
MSKQDDGGPAYPCKVAVGDVSITKGGMSLRDYFAGNFMQQASCLTTTIHGNFDPIAASITAYEMADAMLKARDA